MSWHFEPLVWTARYYDDPNGWERRGHYRAVATVQSIGGGRAIISGMMGEMDRTMYEEIDRALRGLGITELQAWRRKRLVTWR